MKILKLFLFIISLMSYCFAPEKYSHPFIIWLFAIFIYSGYLSFKKDLKEKFFFSFSILYFLSFFLVCFAYPVFLYGTAAKLVYMEFSDPIYINRGTALCQLAFSSYVLGMSYFPDKVKTKITHVSNKKFRFNYFTMPFIGLLCLIIGVLLVKRENGEIINYDVGWSATIYLLCILYTIIITFYSGKIGIYAKRRYLFYAIGISGFLLLIIVQDRGIFLNIVLAFLSVYTFWIKRFSLYKTLAFLFFGILAMSILAQFREKSGGIIGNFNNISKVQTSSSWNNFSDLTSISRNIYEGYEYKEKYGYYKPERAFVIVASPIPFLPQIIQEIFFYENIDTSTSNVLSKYTISKTGINDKGGLGTNSVIDLYMSWGVFGVVLINFLLGFIIKKSRILMPTNIYYAIIYFVLTAFAVYIPRATVFESFRLIIWMLVLAFLLQKKTFSMYKLKVE